MSTYRHVFPERCPGRVAAVCGEHVYFARGETLCRLNVNTHVESHVYTVGEPIDALAAAGAWVAIAAGDWVTCLREGRRDWCAFLPSARLTSWCAYTWNGEAVSAVTFARKRRSFALCSAPPVATPEGLVTSVGEPAQRQILLANGEGFRAFHGLLPPDVATHSALEHRGGSVGIPAGCRVEDRRVLHGVCWVVFRGERPLGRARHIRCLDHGAIGDEYAVEFAPATCRQTALIVHAVVDRTRARAELVFKNAPLLNRDTRNHVLTFC